MESGNFPVIQKKARHTWIRQCFDDKMNFYYYFCAGYLFHSIVALYRLRNICNSEEDKVHSNPRENLQATFQLPDVLQLIFFLSQLFL
jgi:hypothetical protein